MREDAAVDVKPEGRRERSKADKRRRIVAAAATLFAEKGFSGVTTQEIAEAADVGTGTVFRYVSSKAELLMLVMNDELVRGATEGLDLAAHGASPTDAILAVLTPLARAGFGHPENAVVYQRETLFGADGPHRAEAVEHVARLEGAIEEILRLYAASRPTRTDVDLADVAHAVYSTMYVDIVRVGVGRAPADALATRLRRSVDLLVHGLLDAPG